MSSRHDVHAAGLRKRWGRGSISGAVLGTIDKGHLSKELANTVKAVEARNQPMNTH